MGDAASRSPRPRSSGRSLAALIAVAASGWPAAAHATERHFAFTYESGVLAPGQAELEPWTTVRSGREHYYNAIDTRLELELGLVPNLQTSLYWNMSAVSESVLDPASGARTRVNGFELSSIASEWKYKLSDPLADAIGSALYFEGSYGPSEIELEGKLILDKQVQNALFALNLIGEQEWDRRAPETESEQNYGATLAGGYSFTPSLLAGVEVLSLTHIEDGEVESSALYAGPTLAYAADRYWLVLSAVPQVFAPKAEAGEHLDLDGNERVWARALLGFHL